ncbi:MAG TPA: decaprenyl-phosphate phosphoribosyltransferase [Verrucomicrobiae bacterium]|nr:decaprenyl-phosphate phosphoribosyltransferase [Verrucomicrobiae bacterium]
MSRLRDYLLAFRPQQWIKNFFIFLPLVFGKALLEAGVVAKTALGFLIFCAVCSAVYMGNDLLDLERDKLHPSKRLRPIASGKVLPGEARVMAAAVLAAAAPAAWLLNPRFFAVVLIYVIFNLVYSALIKHWVILDVFCLAGFFLLRIFMGSILSGVALSPWIIMMTALLALFLGFNKRRQEIKWLKGDAQEHRAVLSRYNIYFIDQMIGVITASIVIAYSLYAMDARTVAAFGTKHLLATVPFVYYGIFRYLYLIHVRSSEGDPTRIVLSDFPTQINIFLWLASSIAVIYYGI